MKKLTKKERNVIYKNLLITLKSKVWGGSYLCWKFYVQLGLLEEDWWDEKDFNKREQVVFDAFPEFDKSYNEFIKKNGWHRTFEERKIVLNRCIELSK